MSGSKSKPINLKNVVVEMIEESKSGKRFLIDHSDGIEMKAESAAVAQQWVQQIHRVQELHGVRPADSADVVPHDYEEVRRILAEKNAEIAALRAEVERLRRQYGAEPEPGSNYPLMLDRLHNKIHRAKTHEEMEGLYTDSSDDDDLFEDCAQVFAVEDDWSDEDEARPRMDSFRSGERPVLGSAGGRAGGGGPGVPVPAPAVSPIPEAEQEWLGPPGAPCVGLKETCHKVPQMSIEDMPPNSCCDSWAELWNLRIGPNYKKTGAKGPSPPSLYEFVGLECYETPNPCSNIAKYLRIPKVQFETNGLPGVLCVNLQQPNCENPSMWNQSLAGPTLNMAYFWKIKKETADAAANLETASPAVRLFAQYVREAPTFTGDDAGFRGRLKMMCVRNPLGCPVSLCLSLSLCLSVSLSLPHLSSRQPPEPSPKQLSPGRSPQVHVGCELPQVS